MLNALTLNGGPPLSSQLPPGATYDPRDFGILEDIVARLAATGQFEFVHLVCLPEDQGFGANETVAAVVEPVEWSEPVEEFDDGGTVTHAFRWRITLLRREADPAVNAKALDLLQDVAANAVNGQSLAAITFPPMTRIRRGVWNRRAAPEQRVVLNGDCTYEVVGYASHDVTDP